LSRGKLVVLEGIDGAGKTSIAYKLLEDIEKSKYQALYTYEPYNTRYVEILKNEYSSFRSAFLDALTYAADRLLHIEMVIEPAIREGKIVLCDRYYYSSAAYQGAMGAPIDWILEINRFAMRPDIAIYLDIDPGLGLKRRKGLSSRFPEYEQLEILEKVRQNYLYLVDKGLLIMVDASRSFNEVYRDVKELVAEKLRIDF